MLLLCRGGGSRVVEAPYGNSHGGGQVARARSIIALLALVAGTAVPAAGASADPSTPSTLTYEFTACSGPDGTPTHFEAVKQPGGAAALLLTDGSGVFIAVQAVDVEPERCSS
jgi:hypothetical protein